MIFDSSAAVLRETGALCQPINAPFEYTAPLGLIVRSPVEVERFLQENGARLA
jgi:hypothetical protein